jgi:UPF0755 protein
MAEKLNQQLGINKSDFIKLAKEGYMFPDTYDFAPNATAADVVKVLKDNFDKKYTASLQQKIQAKGFNSVQGVILASLVEREARSDEVRKNVASIMLKRLEVGMPLNIDATVQYALGYQAAEKNWWKKSLTYDDLKINSPYNTYLYQGLPPGPICNPSLSSLNAVANADTSIPYLYYFHDLQGNTYYAKTLEEHEANVAKHR